jgi:hypothetical protein
MKWNRTTDLSHLAGVEDDLIKSCSGDSFCKRNPYTSAGY